MTTTHIVDLKGFCKGLLILVVAFATLFVFSAPGGAQQLPPDVMEHMDRARAAMNSNKFEEAIGELRRVLKVAHTCADCYLQLVRAYQKVGAHKDALDTARKLLAVVNDDHSRMLAHNIIGQEISALADAGKMSRDESVREFLSAIQLDPEQPTPYFNMGVNLIKEHREAEGFAALHEYLKRAPEGPSAKTARELLDNPRRARENYVPSDFSLVTKDGEYLTPDDVKGKVVLLDFWASWCKPCEASLPTLQHLSKKYGKEQFRLISISVDSNEQAWKQFTVSHHMDWPQALDRDGKLRRMFNVQPIPTYLLIDQEGIVRNYVIGSGSDQASELDHAVKKSFKNAQTYQAPQQPAQPAPVVAANDIPAAAASPSPAAISVPGNPQPALVSAPAKSPDAAPPTAPTASAVVAASLPPRQPPSPEAPETLFISSNPDGASIYLDQNLIGNAPATLRIPTGKHFVRLTMSGYHPWTNEIAVQDGSEARLHANLVKTTPATVHGRVVWNEQPLAGVPVMARECTVAQPTFGPVTTDSKGNFTITGAPDGRICLSARPPNMEEFGSSSPAMVEIQPGIETTAPDVHLCKLFTPITPKLNESIGQARPALKWNAFPDAVTYAVAVWHMPERQYVAVFSRGQQNRTERIEGTGVQIDADLSPGEYFWRLEAFNRSGHVIGCTASTRFTVTP